MLGVMAQWNGKEKYRHHVRAIRDIFGVMVFTDHSHFKLLCDIKPIMKRLAGQAKIHTAPLLLTSLL